MISLGCVIRGETPHFDYVCAEAARGCTLLALETGVPVAFGVITAGDRAQAEASAGGAVGNKGAEAARPRSTSRPSRGDLEDERCAARPRCR